MRPWRAVGGAGEGPSAARAAGMAEAERGEAGAAGLGAERTGVDESEKTETREGFNQSEIYILVF